MSSETIYPTETQKKVFYVYRITNTVLGKHYYGYRSPKKIWLSPEEDLGTYYFSSSTDKEFIKDQKRNPSHYRYKIIKVFDTVEEAIALEAKFHHKFRVASHESFYNRSEQTSTGFTTSGRKISDEHKAKIAAAGRNRVYGPTPEDVRKRQSEAAKRKPPVSEETRKKLSDIHKGREFTKERCENISKAKKGKPGKPIPDEVKKKMSESAKGKVFSEEHKKNISKSAKNRPPRSEDHCNNLSKSIKESYLEKEKRGEMLRGEASPNYGRQWATNGTDNVMLSAGASIPEGYWRGRTIKQKS